MTIDRSTARTGRATTALLAALLALSLATPVLAQDPEPVLGTVTVDEAVRRALAHNHDLQTTRENIEIAAGRKKQAVQRYLPSLDTGISYRRGVDSPFLFQRDDNFLVTNELYTVSATLSQTLIDWGAIKSIQAAGKSLTASKFDYDQARADLVLLTKQQYYT